MEIHSSQSLLAGKGSCGLHHEGGIQFSCRDTGSGLTHPVTFLQSWSYCAACICPKKSRKEEGNWDFTFTAYLWPIVSLLSVTGKKSIKIWRWEINKCNYISGYQQQTPDKVPVLFWCWGLADSVKKQG